MSVSTAEAGLIDQARLYFAELFVRDVQPLLDVAMEGARLLNERPAERAVAQQRRDMTQDLMRHGANWPALLGEQVRERIAPRDALSSQSSALLSSMTGGKELALVDDDTIQREIMVSRLSLAIMDRASWEFTDLRARRCGSPARPIWPTRTCCVRMCWHASRSMRGACRATVWRVGVSSQPVLHNEFALLAEEGYHEANHWLLAQNVMPEVDLRPFIRRGVHGPSTSGLSTLLGDPGGPRSAFAGMRGAGDSDRGRVGEETRLMTRASLLPRSGEHAEAVLGRLNRLVGRQLPSFGASTRSQAMSSKLSVAIEDAQQGIRQRVTRQTVQGEVAVTTPALLEELHQRKQQLKTAAATPEERATIEIVALLFQSILTEERIPAAVRVWFARLQMPVLRVAVTEPDFFATVDHPARRLIDRMGACVMGFDSAAQRVGDALEREIKRVVQVVEAYPDTGRRVFQTVLTEFDKFLEHYFRTQTEATRKAVSLAQQVEQRETLAVQYTIELRRMLDKVPVQDGVRQFLFHVWADVLATTGVRYGVQSEQTKQMKRAAGDLVWSAGAKVTRDERAEVIRRLPPLLKSLREGMASTGMDTAKQDEQIRALNNSLAAAFTAKAAVIPNDRLQELLERLETLEELLPDAGDVSIDESMVLDVSGHESSDLEVVSDGGSMPTAAMIAWARELQVGSWYMLDFRGRNEPVQLAWHGVRKQLALFVSSHGRCVLFQHQRLAAFLQAGLLLPAQDEALTVRATRSALAKLDVEPSRLLN